MRLIGEGGDCYPVSGGLVFWTGNWRRRTYVFFDGLSLREIEYKAYWNAVIGEVTNGILAQAKHRWDDCGVSVSINKCGDIAICSFEDNTISIFDAHGELQGEFCAQTSFGVNSIAWGDAGIWCAAAADMTVDLYSTTGTLLRVYGTPYDDKELSYPQHVSYRSGIVYISDMGHGRVARFDAQNDGEIETYRFFGEPVWEWHFCESLDAEVVRLKSGIYLLNDE